MTPSESAVHAVISGLGLRVLRTGWPDFLVLNQIDEILMAVEVKSDHDTVKPHQQKIHELLRDSGIEVRVVRERDLPQLREVLAAKMPDRVARSRAHEHVIKSMPTFRYAVRP